MNSKNLENIIENIIESVEDLPKQVENFQTELRKVLGSEFVAHAQISRLGGPSRPSVIVEVWGANPLHNIKQNSPAWITIWAHDIQAGIPVSFESRGNRGLKYRLIKGKDFAEASRKLLDWFKKNRQTMLQLEGK